MEGSDLGDELAERGSKAGRDHAGGQQQQVGRKWKSILWAARESSLGGCKAPCTFLVDWRAGGLEARAGTLGRADWRGGSLSWMPVGQLGAHTLGLC